MDRSESSSLFTGSAPPRLSSEPTMPAMANMQPRYSSWTGMICSDGSGRNLRNEQEKTETTGNPKKEQKETKGTKNVVSGVADTEIWRHRVRSYSCSVGQRCLWACSWRVSS